MEENPRDESRPSNDSRTRPPTKSTKAAPVEKKPSLSKRWSAAQPTKTILFWACIGSVILTIVVGFSWGGWVTGGAAQEAAETMAKDAVVQRLAPICVAQFNLDPEKVSKLSEINDLTSYKQRQYVQDQGWATISGTETPDRKVADACTKLLLEMTP